MSVHALTITSGDATLPATLTLPDAAPLRGGVVTLHSADGPSRDYFLFRHLAALLPQYGVTVLRYDRRSSPDGRDIPFETQAEDALAAVRLLRGYLGMAEAPIGLWGVSQGAWAAPFAASRSADIAFLILIASIGVSPAQQMRFGTAEQLRRAGYGPEALEELTRLRIAYEGYLRGELDRGAVQALVDSAAERPWFPLVYVPRTLPPVGSWRDMDFDPGAIFAQVRCPTLLFYGETDEWAPIEESMEAWRQAATLAGNADVTIIRLPGTNHLPTLHGGREIDTIDPVYSERLVEWLLPRLAS